MKENYNELENYDTILFKGFDDLNIGDFGIWKQELKTLKEGIKKYPDFFNKKRKGSKYERVKEVQAIGDLIKSHEKGKQKIIKSAEMTKKNVYEYYILTRKIIRSKTLSKKEASHLAMMFGDTAISLMPKKDIYPDILVDRLLKLISKTYAL